MSGCIRVSNVVEKKNFQIEFTMSQGDSEHHNLTAAQRLHENADNLPKRTVRGFVL